MLWILIWLPHTYIYVYTYLVHSVFIVLISYLLTYSVYNITTTFSFHFSHFHLIYYHHLYTYTCTLHILIISALPTSIAAILLSILFILHILFLAVHILFIYIFHFTYAHTLNFYCFFWTSSTFPHTHTHTHLSLSYYSGYCDMRVTCVLQFFMTIVCIHGLTFRCSIWNSKHAQYISV